MRTLTRYLTMNSGERMGFRNITDQVERAVADSGVGEGLCLVNADAHHKRQIMGREVVVAITEGRLDLGPWEQIFYGEFDGRRQKRILVKILGQ